MKETSMGMGMGRRGSWRMRKGVRGGEERERSARWLYRDMGGGKEDDWEGLEREFSNQQRRADTDNFH